MNPKPNSAAIALPFIVLPLQIRNLSGVRKIITPIASRAAFRDAKAVAETMNCWAVHMRISQKSRAAA
jgi:hypothetical protein